MKRTVRRVAPELYRRVSQAYWSLRRIPEAQTVRLGRGHYAYGGVRGLIRLAAALLIRQRPRISSRMGRRHRVCPCCGWRGRQFLPWVDGGYVTFGAVCLQCGSHARHRGHRLFYERVLGMSRQAGRALYMAPEGNLEYLRANPRLDVKTSNYGPSDADYDIDILDIRQPDDSWDFIICHRIIEHVPDDHRAMRELFRVLKPGGRLIMSVPIGFDQSKTIEYGVPNPHESMHYYNYGTDFPQTHPRGVRSDAVRLLGYVLSCGLRVHEPFRRLGLRVPQTGMGDAAEPACPVSQAAIR